MKPPPSVAPLNNCTRMYGCSTMRSLSEKLEVTKCIQDVYLIVILSVLNRSYSAKHWAVLTSCLGVFHMLRGGCWLFFCYYLF